MDRVLCTDGSDGETPSNEWRINVLVFDVQTYGSDINFLAEPRPASTRYALLRGISDDYAESCVFSSERMKVQWAGELDALTRFHEHQGQSLPHIIDCYMKLGDTHPACASFEAC
jgi:hypothetical protein